MKDYGKVALCLAGGGARGIVQLGMIQAWLDFGMKYDMLFGTSVGALNGALLHQGSMDEAIHLWMNVKTDDIYRVWPDRLYRPFTSDCCFFNSNPLKKLCFKLIKADKLKNNPIPFYINATEIFPKQKPVMFNVQHLTDEEIPLYIKSSATPPIYFSPETFRGTKLVDGGLVNNFSVLAALEAGADTIVVLTPTLPAIKEPKNILQMLGIITGIPEYEFLHRELQFIDFLDEIQAPFPNDKKVGGINLKSVKRVLIQPKVPSDIGLLDFNYKKDRKSIIKYGYDLTMETLSSELV